MNDLCPWLSMLYFTWHELCPWHDIGLWYDRDPWPTREMNAITSPNLSLHTCPGSYYNYSFLIFWWFWFQDYSILSRCGVSYSAIIRRLFYIYSYLLTVPWFLIMGIPKLEDVIFISNLLLTTTENLPGDFVTFRCYFVPQSERFYSNDIVVIKP